jgi:hypothetical protein
MGKLKQLHIDCTGGICTEVLKCDGYGGVSEEL